MSRRDAGLLAAAAALILAAVAAAAWASYESALPPCYSPLVAPGVACR